MDKKHIMIGAAVAAVIAGGSFWSGMMYAQGSTPAPRGQFSGAGGTGRAGGFRANGNGAVLGSIVAQDSNSITVKLGGANASSTNGADTGSKIVLLDNKTQIGKFVSAAVSDLSVGALVMINGTPNSDGSLTASSIQIRPATAPASGQ